LLHVERAHHNWIFYSYKTTQDAQGDATSGGSSSSLNSNAELCAMINRDMGRIGALFRLPTSLSLIASVPEVFVFNGVNKTNNRAEFLHFNPFSLSLSA